MKKYLILGLLLIIVGNSAILASVVYNRSEALHTIQLNGRDLRSVNSDVFEDSSTLVRMNVRYPISSDSPLFKGEITKEKLKLLGLKSIADQIHDNTYQSSYASIQEEVYLAIQFAGEAYESAILRKQENIDNYLAKMKDKGEAPSNEEVARLRRELKIEEQFASRLFYIDAHKDLSVLQNQYAEQDNTFFMKGEIRLHYNFRTGKYDFSYARVFSSEMMLTQELAHKIEYVDDRDESVPAYYHGLEPNSSFTMHVGRRLEPWISDVRAE